MSSELHLPVFRSAKVKKKIKREHFTNFTARRVDVNERALHRTGLRGRKIFFCCVLFVFIWLLSVLNLILIALLLRSLQFTAIGSSSIRIENGEVVFLERTFSKHIEVSQNGIKSPESSDLLIRGTSAQEIILQGGNRQNSLTGNELPPSQIVARDGGQGGLSLEPVKSLHVSSNTSDGDVLSVSRQTAKMHGLSTLETLKVQSSLITNQVSLANFQPMVSAGGVLSMRGGSGVVINSTRKLTVSAEQVSLSVHKLQLKEITKSPKLVLSTKEGSMLLPKLLGSGPTGGEHRLCACGNGRLFMVITELADCSSNDICV